MRAASPNGPEVAFGPFRLLPTRRLLLHGDRPVRLGSRALEILIALVERPGELVGKNELIARVWPRTFVEEGNLKVQVADLRRALGDRRGSNRYLATISGQGYRFEHPRDVELLSMSSFLLDYPFADRLFPAALEVLRRLRSFGPTVILSDGDVVFQPRKVERAGLSDAVGGRALIYIHTEEALDDVERRYPAEHSVLVDDKLRILAAVKQFWGERVTTVFPRHRTYAHDPKVVSAFLPADVTIECIGDLLTCDLLPLPTASRLLASGLKVTQ